jgi:hypothetical protein
MIRIQSAVGWAFLQSPFERMKEALLQDKEARKSNERLPEADLIF